MKLLFVMPQLYAGGGVETVTARLIRYFHGQPDTEVSVVVGFKAQASDLKLPDGIDVTYLNGLCYRQVIWRLTGHLRRHHPDIVYAATLQANVAVGIAKFLSGNRVPAVGSEHAYLPAYLRAGDAKCAGYLRKLYLLARFFYRYLDMVVFVSEGARQANCRLHHLPQEKSLTIPNAIEISESERMTRQAPDHPWFRKRETPLVVAVGRLVPEKRFDWLIRSFSSVADGCPARLVIFGDGPEKESLEKTIESLGLGNRVSLPGLERNPFRYLSRADVFVMSSEFECCPSAMLEAMACGVPVVSTDCPVGPGEIITDGIDGLLVPMDSPSAMADAILRVIRDRNLSAKLSANARKRADDYDISMIGHALKELFRSLQGG